MRKVSNFISSFCDYASNYEGSYLFRFWSAVAIISATLERKCWSPLGEHQLFPNLYIFLIGDPGTRKTFTAGMAVKLMKDVVFDRGGVQLMQDRLTPASLIKTLKECERTFEYSGKQILHSSCFAYSSELRTMMEDIGGGSLISLLTDFYDSRAHGEKFISRTIKHGAQEITGPGLTFLGCSTPDWFVEILPQSAIGGGFTSRVIFIVQDGPMEKPIAEPQAPDLKLRKDLIETIKAIHNLSGPFEITEGAKAEYKAWYDEFMTKSVRAISDERFKGYAMRKGDFVRKLAMIFSAAQRDDMKVDEFDIVLAIESLTAIEPMMMKAFGPIGDSDRAKNISRIFYKIPEYPDEIKHSDLLKLNWYNVNDSAQFVAEVETLVTMGAIDKRVTGDLKSIYYSRRKNFDLNRSSVRLDTYERQRITTRKGGSTDEHRK